MSESTSKVRLVNVDIDDIDQSQRHRKDLADIEDLIESIRKYGLLHPVVVRLVDDNVVLVAGGRRLAAMKRLGHTRITCTVVEGIHQLLATLEAEQEENTCRRDLKPTEQASLAAALRIEVAAAAQARMKSGKTLGVSSTQGRTRDLLAKAVGTSTTRLGQIEDVIEATESDDPKVAEAAIAAEKEMNESGKVKPAYDKVQAAKNPTKPAVTVRRNTADPEQGDLDEWLRLVRCACKSVPIIRRVAAGENRKILYSLSAQEHAVFDWLADGRLS